MPHNTFHSVCNQTETFFNRCTPTDNDKQSLKLDLCSSISCDFTIDFGAVYFLSLYFFFSYGSILFNSHRQRFGSLRLLPLRTCVCLFVCVSQKRVRARLIRADIFCYCCFLFAKFFTSELHSKLNGAILSTQACISNLIPLNLKTPYSYQHRGAFTI